MRELNLNTEKTIQIVKEEKIEVVTNKVNIQQVIDNNIAVYAVVEINTNIVTLCLWEGDAYHSIGNWTDTDVNNRILELI